MRRTLLPGLVFFFKPIGPFNIPDVGEFPRLNRNGHLHQEGENEKTGCPDAKGNHEFEEIGHIIVDFS